jgi:hypothetical protein
LNGDIGEHGLMFGADCPGRLNIDARTDFDLLCAAFTAPARKPANIEQTPDFERDFLNRYMRALAAL